MDANGSNITQLTNPPSDAVGDRQPAWSPDGTQIAFTTDRGGGFGQEIYLVEPNVSGTPDALEGFTSGASYPSWSPDGSQLVFVQPNQEGGLMLVRINADGSNSITLTDPNSTTFNTNPDWSPVE